MECCELLRNQLHRPCGCPERRWIFSRRMFNRRHTTVPSSLHNGLGRGLPSRGTCNWPITARSHRDLQAAVALVQRQLADLLGRVSSHAVRAVAVATGLLQLLRFQLLCGFHFDSVFPACPNVGHLLWSVACLKNWSGVCLCLLYILCAWKHSTAFPPSRLQYSRYVERRIGIHQPLVHLLQRSETYCRNKASERKR